MFVNIVALLFITTIPTLTILNIIKKNRQVQLLKEMSKKKTGILINITKFKQQSKEKRLQISYMADFEYCCQGHEYVLRDMNYEFIGKYGDIEDELERKFNCICAIICWCYIINGFIVL